MSRPHSRQPPGLGTQARGSRWPKGDTQSGPSDSLSSDAIWCTDFGKLKSDNRFLRAPPERSTQRSVGQTSPGSQRKPRLRSG